MSQGAEKKRRKLYLRPGSSFVVPHSTLWYNKQRGKSSSQSPSAAQGEGSNATDRVPLQASPPANQSSPEDCFHSAHSDGETSTEGSIPEDTDEAGADTDEAGTDTDEAGAETGSEDDDDAAASFAGDMGDSDGDQHRGHNAMPPFDESELLAQCISEFGSKTLPGSETTVAVAIVLIMSFIASQGLPWSAVGDLLKLVEALFGFQHTGLPNSKYLFRKLWSVKCASVASHHYCCDKCGKLMQMTADKKNVSCLACSTNSSVCDMKSGGTFFAILDVKQQLYACITRLSGVLYGSLCQLRQQAEEIPHIVKDFTSGLTRRSLYEKGVLRWSDLTVTVNTDGSPLYKSSNSSIWPIQIVVNELPLAYRHKNVILGGLWFGRKHPDMGIFLGKFVEVMRNIGDLLWESASTPITTTIYTVCVCVDAPARAAVGNHVQFNGFFGCPWCLACPQSQEGRRLYIDPTPDVERTAAGVRRDMALASMKKTPVNGLKGMSPLQKLPYFDLVWGYTVEYLHCVLLGVTRQFTDYWLDSSNSQEEYYIGRPRTLEVINRRLLCIRPPHHFTRLPRTLRERCYWKAHEWRNWLLYYCLPCCRHLLPRKYFRHFSFLAEAVFTLLLEQLTFDQIDHAERLLRAFVSKAASLYGQRCMTFNVHQLLHLAQAVRNFGPLWAHSAFIFETGNGQFVKLVNAAKGVPGQIVERVLMLQELRNLLSVLPLSAKVRTLCLTFLDHPKTKHAQCVETTWMFGLPKAAPSLSDQEASCLQSCFGHVPPVQEHFRFSYLGTIFHSENYRAGKKNSSVFECKESGFYIIKRIFEATEASVSDGQAILLCAKIVANDSTEELPSHVSERFFSLAYSLLPLKITDIAKPCVLLSFNSSEHYVCSIPNLVERD